MKKLLRLVCRVWAQEPVLVGSALPLLATLGVLTQDEASALVNAVAGAGAVVGELAVAFGVRSRVSPVGKVVKPMKAAPVVEPTTGPSTPSGVGSANTPAVERSPSTG